MDNKQLIHVAGEVLMIGGITYYFNSRCKILEGKTMELIQYINRQNDRIEELEKVVFGRIHHNQIASQMAQQQMVQQQRKEKKERKEEIKDDDGEEEIETTDADIENELKELQQEDVVITVVSAPMITPKKETNSTVELVEEDEIEFVDPEQFKKINRKKK
jgi:hypothetical protein